MSKKGRLSDSREASENQRERDQIAEEFRNAASAGKLAEVSDIISAYGDDASMMNATDTRIVSPHFGRTALVLAVQGGHHDIVKALLLAPGVNHQLNAATHIYRPLPEAARYNHTEIVKTLLTLPDIDINGVDYSGWTPLMFVAKSGNQELIDLLVKAGANCRLRNKHEQSAADIAKENLHHDIAASLAALAAKQRKAKRSSHKSHSSKLFAKQMHDADDKQAVSVTSFLI